MPAGAGRGPRRMISSRSRAGPAEGGRRRSRAGAPRRVEPRASRGQGEARVAARALGERRRRRSRGIREQKPKLEDVRREGRRRAQGRPQPRRRDLKYRPAPEHRRSAGGRAGEAGRACRQRSGCSRRRSTPRTSPQVVSKWTGIPVTSSCWKREMREIVQHWKSSSRERVIGQDEAVKAVSNGGPPRALRPPGPGPADRSLHFLGPTGVGKTELARALAEFLFDNEKAMIRLDMSEYMEKHSVAPLDRRAPRVRRI